MLYSKHRYSPVRLVQDLLRLMMPACFAASVLFSHPGFAEPDLIGGDMGLSSSATGNQLFDSDTDNAVPPPKLSPAEAADLVRRKVGGQVMSVSTQQHDTGVVYGVKVLNAGRMRVINVDGQSGKLLNQ